MYLVIANQERLIDHKVVTRMDYCYYHHTERSIKECTYCNKPICEQCFHQEFTAYCWSCGLDFDNGNLIKKRKNFHLPKQLGFIKSKSFILSGIAFLLLVGVFTSIRVWNMYQLKYEMKSIEFNGVHLFMHRQEVSKIYGPGTDKSFGCFGCEMNFIYPELKLSGRYSETLGSAKGRDITVVQSPLVKMMTTADSAYKVFNIRTGDSFDTAERILEAKGFIKEEGNSHYYVKKDYYVQLWNDDRINNQEHSSSTVDTDNMIRSITIGYRVKRDELINY